MMIWLSLFFLLPVLGDLTREAEATVIHSTFGPGDTDDNNRGWTVGHILSGQVEVASRFIVHGGNYAFETVEIAAGLTAGPNLLQVALASDAAGLPGTIVEEFTFVGALGLFVGSHGLVTGVSSSHPILFADTRYWLVASTGPDTQLARNQSITGQLGLAGKHDDQPWFFHATHPSGAVRISRTAISEPSNPGDAADHLGLAGICPVAPPIRSIARREKRLNRLR